MLTKALFIVCLITSLCVIASGSRADLGTYLNINDFSNGLPVSEERVTVDNYVLAYINYTYNTSDGKVINFSAERAKYGEGKILNVQGILVHVTSEGNVNDHTACMPPLRGNKGQILPSTEPWIALVRRGECTFEDKVKHIWRYRAVGVIIYDEENSVILDKMKIVDKERNITAVFTHKWIGEEMAKIVDSGNRVIVSISEGQRIRPMPNINKTSVLFVSISFIVLMIISLVWLIFYYVQRFRYLQSKDKHSRHLCSVAKRIIAKIPTRNIKNDEKDIGNDCCPICIELYKVTDCIRILPCKHEFHKNCIDPWLLEHRTCPMCKLDVLKHYGFVVGDPLRKLSSQIRAATQDDNNSSLDNAILNTQSNNNNPFIDGITDNIEFSNDVPSSSSSTTSSSSGSSNSSGGSYANNRRSARNSGGYTVANLSLTGFTESRQVTDFIGSQESILQLDLDMEIGNEGLQNRDNESTSNNHHQSINISTSIFQLPPLRGVNNIIRSSSLEFLVVAEREIIPERSKSSMSCVNNASDGYFIGQSSNVAKLERNCISKIYSSHILKKEEYAKKNGKAVDCDFGASNRLLENKTSMDKVDQSIAEKYVCKKSLYDTEVESFEEVVKNEESRKNRNINSESDSTK